jgi:cell wall-associated NlpC family hydrolase
MAAGDPAAIAFASRPRLWRRAMTAQRPSFQLSGTSVTLDERMHAVRGDLADLALAGTIFVPHYGAPMAMICTVSSVPVRDKGSADADATSELLLGEAFMALDLTGGWAWGYCAHDHYVGYVPEAALIASDDPVATSVITQRETSVLSAPGGTAVAALPMGARVSATAGDWVETPLGLVAASAVDEAFADPVAVAERLIDVPYVWGGRSGAGVDCSGLVQIALALTGTASPRDSDQQQVALGTPIPDGAPLMRNDLVFFPGHVGWMLDDTRLLHATRRFGKVTVEPLADVVARSAEKHDVPVLARKRLG